jgi:glycerophosphoryl diester phosphodiesterase
MKKLIWVIFLALLLVVAWFFRDLIAFSLKASPTMSELTHADFAIIAHRGASGHAPENTLSAFRKGLDMGADMIEMDIHLSSDGELIVIHDATLNRTTNGVGRVEDFTLAELKKLDAGSWYGPAFSSEKLPTLSEVLSLIDGQATALIELKSRKNGDLYSQLVEKTTEVVRAHNAERWSIIQSFDRPYLVQGLKVNNDIPYHQLIYTELTPRGMTKEGKADWANLDPTHKIRAINPYYKAATKEKVEMLHESGYKIFTYTVNQEEDMYKLIEMEVDGIITNYPDKLNAIRQKILSEEM